MNGKTRATFSRLIILELCGWLLTSLSPPAVYLVPRARSPPAAYTHTLDKRREEREEAQKPLKMAAAPSSGASTRRDASPDARARFARAVKFSETRAHEDEKKGGSCVLHHEAIRKFLESGF